MLVSNITSSRAIYADPELMSPISNDLRELRNIHGLRQGDLATKLGYEQSYVSAIEVGSKGPPTQEFVERLISVLALDDAWRARLLESLDASQRKLTVPGQAPESVFRLCNELRKQIDHLHPAQVELIRAALQIPERLLSTQRLENGRAPRRNSIRQKCGVAKM